MKNENTKIKKIIITIIAATITVSTVAGLTGCGCEKQDSTPDTATSNAVLETTMASTVETTSATEATPKSAEEKKKEDAIKNADLTVKNGKVVDKNGKEVTEVKTSDGTTVKVSASDVSSTNSGNSSSSSSSNSGSTSSKNNSSSSNSSSSSKTDSGNSSSDNKTYHEAVYKEVKHAAVYEDKWVVTQKAYSYEEPVYEQQERAICSDCGADLTELGQNGIIAHIQAHRSEGGKGGWYSKWIDVQTGTETVTVPEEGHYESIKVKDAWTEKVLVKAAGWY